MKISEVLDSKGAEHQSDAFLIGIIQWIERELKFLSCVSRLFKVSFSSNSSCSLASYSEQSHLSLDYNYNIYSDDPQVYIQTQTL